MIKSKSFVYICLVLAGSASCVHPEERSLDEPPATAPASEVIAPRETLGVVSTWVELGDSGRVVARLVTTHAECPPLLADAKPLPTLLRAPINAAFPNTVCEAVLPQDIHNATWGGRDLPLLRSAPKRIALLGDTGCRLKKIGTFNLIQDCNSTAWPFAQVALAIAAQKPDLIIHVGDYHYRELSCPPEKKGCLGAVSGDNWLSWQQDFFTPGQPLLSSAPMIFVRGNHEVCKRAGSGWFRLLDPRPLPASCTDGSAPYSVTAGDHRLVVIDAADDANMQPSFDQLQASPGQYTWWLLHRPFLTPKGDTEAKHSAHLPAAFSAPGALAAIFTGHKHIAEFTSFTAEQPPELITGNGGSLLFPHAEAEPTVTATHTSALNTMRSSAFGFLMLERQDAGGWAVIERDSQGGVVFRCVLGESQTAKSSLRCEKPAVSG